MDQQDKVFAQGMMFRPPRANAPAFILGGLSIKVDEFIAFLQAHNTNAGWVNIDIKESKGGKWYCELNQFKPERPASVEPKEEPAIEYPEEDINPDDVPF
jgi:hypothetical protein